MVASNPAEQTHLKSDYLRLVERRRLYSGILLLIFIALLIGGFDLADSRNAGGFWDGLHRLAIFPMRFCPRPGARSPPCPSNWLNFALLAGDHQYRRCLDPDWRGDRHGPGPAVDARHGALAAFDPAVSADHGRHAGDSRNCIALVLIFILGGGPMPAMIAIAFHTSGALGKTFSEVNENADLKPVEGLTAVGATWIQRMWLGVIPQVAPNYASYALLRFEINIRASAILGFVGSGGIGYDLKNTMSWGKGRYDEATAIFILLFLTIVVLDQISSHVRKKLVEGGEAPR